MHSYAQEISQAFNQTDNITPEEKQKDWDYYFKLGAGWSSLVQEEVESNVSSDFSSRFAWRSGVGVEYVGARFLGVAAELEYSNIGHKLKSNYGGLTGSSDFVEKTTYSINYLSITAPKITWHNNVIPIYIGLVSNYKLGGSVHRDREATGMKTVDDSNEHSIKNLRSSVYSLRFGFGDKKSNYMGRH